MGWLIAVFFLGWAVAAIRAEARQARRCWGCPCLISGAVVVKAKPKADNFSLPQPWWKGERKEQAS